MWSPAELLFVASVALVMAFFAIDEVIELKRFRRERDQDAAGEPLQGPQRDHLTKAMGLPAERREQEEKGGVGEQIAAQRKHSTEQICQRDDDDLADQIGGRYPSAVSRLQYRAGRRW
jgi:flagellar biosynthesis/type III secretory pathway M-ring protein FliF/YscJ